MLMFWPIILFSYAKKIRLLFKHFQTLYLGKKHHKSTYYTHSSNCYIEALYTDKDTMS